MYQSWYSGACLHGDYANAYAISTCQYVWEHVPLANDEVLIKRSDINRCLAQFDYNNVYMTVCNSGHSGHRWRIDHPSGTLFNVGVERYLTVGSGTYVYLQPNAWIGQNEWVAYSA
jgi:hypothetical protein